MPALPALPLHPALYLVLALKILELKQRVPVNYSLCADPNLFELQFQLCLFQKWMHYLQAKLIHHQAHQQIGQSNLLCVFHPENLPAT